MADERDFEELDDYLTNRMSERDRSAFEHKLKADPDLQHQHALQEKLIQGIKDARVAELKSMLNNVSIPAGNPGNTIVSKIIFGTAASVLIVAASFWYFTDNERSEDDQNAGVKEQVPPVRPDTSEEQSEAPQVDQPESTADDKQPAETDKNQTSAGTEHSRPSLATKPAPLAAPGEKDAGNTDRQAPKPDVFTPENEDTSKDKTPERERGPNLAPKASSLVVETDRTNRRYAFHYQFRDGKLVLYGPFEKNLYEIMEFFTDDKRTVFLYYKDHYYLLPEVNENIRPLTAITDAMLINKLKEYRNSK